MGSEFSKEERQDLKDTMTYFAKNGPQAIEQLQKIEARKQRYQKCIEFAIGRSGDNIDTYIKLTDKCEKILEGENSK